MKPVGDTSSVPLNWQPSNDTVSYLKCTMISLAHTGSIAVVAAGWTLVAYSVAEFVSFFFLDPRCMILAPFLAAAGYMVTVIGSLAEKTIRPFVLYLGNIHKQVENYYMIGMLISAVVFAASFLFGFRKHLDYPASNPYVNPMILSFFGFGYSGILGQQIFKC